MNERDGMGFTVRGASPEDAPAVREIVRSVLDEYGLPPDPGGIDRDLEDLDSFYFARGGGKRVELETASVLVEAIGLYTKAGFTQLPRSPDAQRCDKVFALDL
jgi:hypothetical protein